MNLKNLVEDLGRLCVKKTPEILFGFGVAGIFVTVGTTVHATVKATRRVDAEEQKPEPKEAVKMVWKYYIPPAISTVMTLSCFLAANTFHVRRQAALAAAYSLSETALREYREKVIETVGEKKELSIRDAVAKEKLEKVPIANNEIILTDKNETRFFDALSGRRFKSSVDLIKKAVITLNQRLLYEQYVSLNDLYFLIGLPENGMGSYIGWNIEKGLIEVRFSAQVDEDEEPCLVIEFVNPPQYEFDR